MLLTLKMQKEVPEPSPSTLLSSRVCGAGFSHSSSPLYHPAALWIPEDLVLNLEKNFLRRVDRKLAQSLRESPRLNEYHIVVYTTMYDNKQVKISCSVLKSVGGRRRQFGQARSAARELVAGALGKLAPHVAELAGFGMTILTAPGLDFATGSYRPPQPQSAADLV